MLISNQLAYYFFSALLQANAAIFSIIGVFYIFRIQSLNNEISIIKSNVMEDRGRLIHSSKVLLWEKLTIHEKEKELKNKKSKYQTYAIHFRRWIEIEINNSILKKYFIVLFIFVAFVLTINAVSLFLLDYLLTINLLQVVSWINLIAELLVIVVIVITIIKIVTTRATKK